MEFQTTCDTLLSDYQIRKSGKQKQKFIQFVQDKCNELGLDCSVEKKNGLFCNRNIVVGDIKTANIICTAHYDTCAVWPFPNFITPKNIFIFVFAQLFFLGIFCGVFIGISELLAYLIHGLHSSYIFYILLLGFCVQLFAGFPNKHTANDNTSGVATLLSLMHNIPKEDRGKIAFVFFDNEEVGMIGSSHFKKLHKKIIADKFLINFDCVSDGNHFLFISKKKAIQSDIYPLFKNTLEEKGIEYGKHTEFLSASRAIYPSDQILFGKSIGVAALKKSPIFGLYMDRVHTPKDVIFDRRNIEFLYNSITTFVSKIQSKQV